MDLCTIVAVLRTYLRSSTRLPCLRAMRTHKHHVSAPCLRMLVANRLGPSLRLRVWSISITSNAAPRSSGFGSARNDRRSCWSAQQVQLNFDVSMLVAEIVRSNTEAVRTRKPLYDCPDSAFARSRCIPTHHQHVL